MAVNQAENGIDFAIEAVQAVDPAVDGDPVYNNLKEIFETAIADENILTVREIIQAGSKYREERQDIPPLPEDQVLFRQDAERLNAEASRFAEFLNSISKGNVEMVSLVLMAKPDLLCMNIHEYGPLQLAATMRNQGTRRSMANLLIEAGTKYSTTCVHQAVANNDFDLVKIFLAAGAHLNCFDVYGALPFHVAYQFILGNRALFYMIKNLVDYGADVNLIGKGGSTFLHYVCASPNCTWELVKLLLDLEAELNILNLLHVSPVALATRSGNSELIRNMIQTGADINISKKCTGSPLQVDYFTFYEYFSRVSSNTLN
ncbi:hypothetical protein QAD02_013873 [Eretmocerus hayati]|uniref:Uncharacterized protein n=1 Tax=Eretmocerus hayati TaxID=131215 RepID=A0ACC2P5G3_9HYME|nr:hypothetical protein QAD02_013873 [Eretmocerus hayati]